MSVLYHRFASEAWLITAAGAAAFQTVFRYDVPATLAKGRNFLGDTVRDVESRDGVEIIPVDGPLIHRAGFLDKGFGARAHEDVAEMVQTAADKKPKAIVLDIHSPGGTVAGTSETASVIAKARNVCPVIAYSDGLCASAAYWYASQANSIYGTASSTWGSVGAMLETISFARALEAAGIDPKVFQSSPLKGTGHPLIPMGEKNAAYLQSHVETAGKMFTSAVKKNRPRVSSEALDGRMFFASEAENLGLIDGVVSSLSDVIGIATGARPAPSSRASLSASESIEQARAESAAIATFVNFVKSKNQNQMNAENQIQSLEAQGRYEEAYALLSPEEKSQFMGAKSYAAFKRAGSRAKVYGSKKCSFSSRDPQ